MQRWWPTNGDVFALPIAAQWAFGVVVRHSFENSSGIVASFFPFLFDHVPRATELPAVAAADAVFTKRSSTLKIKTGEWPIVGRITRWSDADWPMPRFARAPRIPGGRWLVEIFDDNDLTRPARIVVVDDPVEAAALPESGSAGCRFVEIRMTKLLAARASAPFIQAPAGWYTPAGELPENPTSEAVDEEPRPSGLEIALTYRVEERLLQPGAGHALLIELEDTVLPLLAPGVDDVDGIESGAEDGVLRLDSTDPDGLWGRVASVVSALPVRPIEVRLHGPAGTDRIALQ